MDLNVILQNGAVILTIIGAMATFVTIVTEFTKSWGFLDRIPTSLQVLAVSMLVSILSVVIYVQMQKAEMVWYYIVGAIVLGWIVAYVSMYGWEKLTEMWGRFKK